MDDTIELRKRVLLKILNRILVEINREEITDIKQFVDIRREEIIKIDILSILQSMIREFFAYFEKPKCGWYRRKLVKNYIIIFLKGACESIKYKLISTKKDVLVNVNGKSYRRNHIFYSIV